jgi:membrane protease YdiL (CAAX protease family)
LYTQVLQKKRTYQLIISIALLLFVQVVIPNLHNHKEQSYAQGINEDSGEHCLICSLDIVAADFILPAIFSILLLALIFKLAYAETARQSIVFSIHAQGRGPPRY